MSFIKSELMTQKLLEAEANIDDFLKNNGIDDNTMIHGFILDKEVFVDKAEAIEWVKSRDYFADDIMEDDTSFMFKVRQLEQFMPETIKDIELRRGVKMRIGELMPIAETFDSSQINFNDGQCEIKLKPIDILNFHAGAPHIIEIARVVKGYHPRYGEVEITETDLVSMEKNFKTEATGVELAVNKDHKKEEALGWFKSVFLSFDGKTLLGEIDWCPEGVSLLRNKSFRYFSPEFTFNYSHPHTGESLGVALTGGALTNYPFLKMGAITELNNKQQNKEVKMQTIELSVHENKLLELNNAINAKEVELNTANKTVNSLKASNVELNDKVKDLEASIEAKETEAKNEKLFNDGKINAAQLKAMNEGKSTHEILELSATLNEEAQGKGPNGENGKTDFKAKLTESEIEYCDKNDHTYEFFYNTNNEVGA